MGSSKLNSLIAFKVAADADLPVSGDGDEQQQGRRTLDREVSNASDSVDFADPQAIGAFTKISSSFKKHEYQVTL